MNPNLAAEILNHTMEYVHCTTSPRWPLQKIIQRIRWVRPPEGWTKLNTDGSAITNLGMAGCGGIMRNEGG